MGSDYITQVQGGGKEPWAGAGPNLISLQPEGLVCSSLRALRASFFFFVFCLFRATPAAHGGSQAKGPIGAVAAGLYHSQSNAESELRLRSIPQLTATPDP